MKGQKEVRVQAARERKPQEVHVFEGGFDLAVLTFQPETAGWPYAVLELGDLDAVAELDPIILSGYPERGAGEFQEYTIKSEVNILD